MRYYKVNNPYYRDLVDNIVIKKGNGYFYLAYEENNICIPIICGIDSNYILFDTLSNKKYNSAAHNVLNKNDKNIQFIITKEVSTDEINNNIKELDYNTCNKYIETIEKLEKVIREKTIEEQKTEETYTYVPEESKGLIKKIKNIINK